MVGSRAQIPPALTKYILSLERSASTNPNVSSERKCGPMHSPRLPKWTSMSSGVVASAEFHRGTVAREVDETGPRCHVRVDVLDSEVRRQDDRRRGMRSEHGNSHLRGLLSRPAKDGYRRP